MANLNPTPAQVRQALLDHGVIMDVYAEVDVEVSNYRLNAIKSGFNAGTIVNFNNGKPSTDEEAEKIEEKMKEKFQGTDVANSLLLSFNRSKESAVTIARLQPQNSDEQLDSLNDQVTQELIIGHRITNPMLVGIKTPGELGGKDQISESFMLYKSTYIEPKFPATAEDVASKLVVTEPKISTRVVYDIMVFQIRLMV